ncbi:MAG TPA: carbohydrate ABC transporter permease [Candidatus Limiplasma sp.]|nr:carbohydrate ABC transporter permease [Candidatus Limiplasma sp.]
MKKNAYHIALWIFLGLLLILTLAPILWVLISSLKTQGEMLMTPWAPPKNLLWSNYAEAWKRGKFLTLMQNSITVTGASLLLMLAFSTMAAFAISRYQTRYNNVMMVYLLVGQTISAAMIVFPIVLVLRQANLNDSLPGLILTYTAGGIPFATFVMQGFMAGIPHEIYEAAEIDSASESRLFWSMAIPLAKPALATVLLYQFMWVWNEFPLAFTLISTTSKRTLIVGLYTVVNGQLQTNYVLAFAGATIVSVPIIALYLIFQKYLIQGLVAGAVKG